MLSTILAAVGLLSALCAPQDATHVPRNVVVILADDMGHGNVSARYADGKIPTPNIDRLDREGMLFTVTPI